MQGLWYIYIYIYRVIDIDLCLLGYFDKVNNINCSRYSYHLSEE